MTGIGYKARNVVCFDNDKKPVIEIREGDKTLFSFDVFEIKRNPDFWIRCGIWLAGGQDKDLKMLMKKTWIDHEYTVGAIIEHIREMNTIARYLMDERINCITP